MGTPVPSRPPRRFSPSTVAFLSVGVVVVVVLALVIVKVTSSSPPPPSSVRVTAPAALVHEVASIPDSVFETVGVPSSVLAPKVVKNQAPLTASGKPEVLYIGAEFCPYCAAERWAIVAAFSRFGSFSGLKEIVSSAYDVDPQTATFSFYGASYSSNLFHFSMIEHETNDTTGPGTRALLMPLTSAQSTLWTKYSAQFGQQTGFPFMDIGNKVLILGPAYDPQLLQGLDQTGIAAKLKNPSDPISQAVIGEANYLTAGLCSLTGGQPAAVCNAASTKDATKALGLS